MEPLSGPRMVPEKGRCCIAMPSSDYPVNSARILRSMYPDQPVDPLYPIGPMGCQCQICRSASQLLAQGASPDSATATSVEFTSLSPQTIMPTSTSESPAKPKAKRRKRYDHPVPPQCKTCRDTGWIVEKLGKTECDCYWHREPTIPVGYGSNRGSYRNPANVSNESQTARNSSLDYILARLTPAPSR